jgi:hypothetical protein
MLKKLFFIIYNIIILLLLLFILFYLEYVFNGLFIPRELLYSQNVLSLFLFLVLMFTQGEILILLLYKINKWFLFGFNKNNKEPKLLLWTTFSELYIIVSFIIYIHSYYLKNILLWLPKFLKN